MGGTITVESEVGRGSTFRFTARFGRSMKSASPGVVGWPPSLEGLRVLIADDNATNRQVLDQWLGSWRMRSESVGDAASALEALTRAAERGEPFSLVLLDCPVGRHLPGAVNLSRARPPGSRLIDSTAILLACGGKAGLLESSARDFSEPA